LVGPAPGEVQTPGSNYFDRPEWTGAAQIVEGDEVALAWVGGADNLRHPMPSGRPHTPTSTLRVRTAGPGDIDALIELEQRVFATDQLSRRSLRRFLRVPTAAVLVAKEGGHLAGTAIVLFRPNSAVARLYSIAVTPRMSGRGVAPKLLAAAERIARGRGCGSIRLEVHQTNLAAISRYRKSGYQEFGRHARYYEDGGDALRFQKPLGRVGRGAAASPGRASPRGASRK
jgi:ribosomal protein S18 acetylase RimI-like enzyme